MPNVTITIPLPVLTSGQYFVTKYRLVGAPTWIDISPQDNDPFNINGLAEGDYELSASLAKGSPVTLCDEVIYTFTVVDQPGCMDYNVVMLGDRDIYQLRVDWNVPSPLPDICFIEIDYGPVGGPSQIAIINPFSSPYFGFIILPATNETYIVTITQVSCSGNYFPCETFEVDPPDGGCDNAIIEDAELEFRQDGTWWIVLTVTQSNPYTNPFIVSYNQNDAVNTGQADPGGTINMAATISTTVLEFQVYPNIDVVLTNGAQTIHYTGSISDYCRESTQWEAEFTLS